MRAMDDQRKNQASKVNNKSKQILEQKKLQPPKPPVVIKPAPQVADQKQRIKPPHS